MAKQHANRTHLTKLQAWGQVNAEALNILHDSGFVLISKINTGFKTNWRLIDHVIDAYDAKDYCFVFGDKKITPTFEDVARITGFPIDGELVTGKDFREDACKSLSVRLLNEDYVRPRSSDILFDNLLECQKYENPEQINVYVRAYALFVIACFLLPGKAQDSVPCMYLSLLNDVHKIKNYAWGSALLCQMHNELAAHKKHKNGRKSSFAFCVPFLEIFFFEHFPMFPEKLYEVNVTNVDYSAKLSEFPLVVGWTNLLELKTKNSYTRPLLNDVLNVENILWQPYKRLSNNFLPVYLQSQMPMWSAVTVIICFSQFAWHLPFICPLKFGKEEGEDLAQSYDVFKLESRKRNASKVNWRTFRAAQKPIESWNSRHSNIVYPSYYEDDNVVESNDCVENNEGMYNEGMYNEDNEDTEDNEDNEDRNNDVEDNEDMNNDVEDMNNDVEDNEDEHSVSGSMEEPIGHVEEPSGNVEEPSGNVVEEPTGNVEKQTENIEEPTGNVEKPAEILEEQGNMQVIENTTNNKSEHDNNLQTSDSEKKWPGWPGENVFRILVPSQKVGSIIGRKGEFIKKMCEESRARIKILDGPQGAQERAVMISAKEEHDASFSPAMDGLLKVHKRTIDGLNNDTSTPAPPNNMVFTRLLVPATQAGSLIGKQGATIKTVQEGSNCTIRILEDVPPIALQDDRVVEIQGKPVGVHKAVELIASHLRKFLVDRSVIQLFEIQMQTPRHPHMEPNIPPPQPWGPPQGPPTMGGNLGYGGNPSYGSSQVYGGNPSYGGNNPSYGGNNPSYNNPPPYMPPARPQDNYVPPTDIPPYEKPLHRGISTYGREAPSPASQQPSSNASQVTQQMQVPLAYADAVIGNAGANISYIRRVSGATVTIQETRGVPGEMTVEITGTATQAQTAQQLMQNYMAEAASASTVPTATAAHNPTMPTDQGYNYYQSMYMAPPTAANDGPPAQPTAGYGSTYGSYGY